MLLGAKGSETAALYVRGSGAPGGGSHAERHTAPTAGPRGLETGGALLHSGEGELADRRGRERCIGAGGLVEELLLGDGEAVPPWFFCTAIARVLARMFWRMRDKSSSCVRTISFRLAVSSSPDEAPSPSGSCPLADGRPRAPAATAVPQSHWSQRD